MTKLTETKGESHRFQLGLAGRLNRAERIVLLAIVATGALLDFLGFLSSPDANPVHSALSICSTLTFALYIWSPAVATSALGVVVALSFLADKGLAGLLAAAIAAAPVLRLAGTRLVIAYVGGLLVTTAIYAYYGEGDSAVATNVALALIVAALAGGVGLALRTAYARGHRLERELAEQAEREREAVLAERRWIAGELHDSIAHHLTIIALHVQLLDDDGVREESQESIRIAARKALSDLRFVIGLAEDKPLSEVTPSEGLASAIDEATAEFEAVGHSVVCLGDPGSEQIPRGVEIILARIVRESATNILKYAGRGEVRFSLDLGDEACTLEIRSPLPETPRSELPSTGTGLNRMAERVLGVQGDFSAGAIEDAWITSVRLPTA